MKDNHVIYIDAQGAEHDALITARNGMHQGVVDLAYVDANGEMVKKFAVYPHTDESKQDNNPELPSYALNAYKLPGESHKAVPEDHPIFDHPFKAPEKDSDGNVVEKPRPKFAADVAEHVKALGEKIEEAAEGLGNAVGEGFESR